MRYLVVHGIGDTKPGWSKDLYIELGCRADEVTEFHWEDNVERGWFDRVLRWLFYKTPISKKLLDYGADVPRYFFDKRLRESIIDELSMAMHLMNEPFYLVGFSLGSVICIETLAAINERDTMFAGLATLGSPIDRPIIRRMINHPKTLRRRWVNLWSYSDSVSSKIMVDYTQPLNFAVGVGHVFEAYAAKLREILKRDTL